MKQSTALKVLKYGASVFLTGEPGSGKTFLVDQYIRYLRDNGVEPAITASTGVAATHLGGITIHAWSGLGARSRLNEYELEAVLEKKQTVRRIEKTNILIIDEISMLEADTLDSVERIIRTAKRSSKPFGGMQVVLVGDFFQLPPVSKTPITRFAFEAESWAEVGPVTCYLTEQFRQEDKGLLELLRGLRTGKCLPTHREKLLARIRRPDREVAELYTHNVDVNRLNDSELAKLSGPEKVYLMEERGPKPLVDGLKRGCLSPERLVLKKGAVVMCTKNNFEGGFVNGTLGRIEGFTAKTGEPMVRTFNGRTFKVRAMDWNLEEGGKIKARVNQLPLRLAWAMTVHKSQGVSLDAARVDLSGAFEFGQGYVALSRVRRMEGLFLRGLNDRALEVHPAVVGRDQWFRAHSEAAEVKFKGLTGERKRKRRQEFLRSVGGGQTSSKVKKVDTYELTLREMKEAKDLVNLAEKRGLTVGTICTHLERLAGQGSIEPISVLTLWQGGGRNANHLKEAVDLFKTHSGLGLTEIKKKLDDRFSYEELRLARIYKDL